MRNPKILDLKVFTNMLKPSKIAAKWRLFKGGRAGDDEGEMKCHLFFFLTFHFFFHCSFSVQMLLQIWPPLIDGVCVRALQF